MKTEGDQNSNEELQYKEKMDQVMEQEIKKNSEPLWLTKQFVEKPCIVVSVCLTIIVLCIVGMIAGNFAELAENHDRDFLIWSDQRTQDYDKYELIQEEFLKGQIDSVIPERSQENDEWTTYITLRCDDGCSNILTLESIKALYEAEQAIKNHKDYTKFCLASTSDPACSDASFISLTSFFDDMENLTQDQIDSQFQEILDDDDLFDQWKGFLGKTFTKENPKAKVMLSIFKFGAPLNINGKRFSDIYDDDEKQADYFEDFSEDINDTIKDKIKKPKNVQIMAFSDIIEELEFQETLMTDFLLALGSIVFVWIYLSIHLKSLFLGSMSMLTILFSFPITLVLFGGVFQISYFSSLHILVVFIVLGIGADDIFVYTDAWNQTATYKSISHDMNKRMAFTFRRASKAMLATSSTTAAAFLATGLSEIMPIASFGFFAGILIPVNYILIITFYPAILILYEKYTKNWCVCKKNKKVQKKQENNEDVEQQQQQQVKKIHPVEEFFGGKFNNFTNKYKFPIMISFLIYICIAIWRVTRFSALSEPEQFMPDDFDSVIVMNALRYEFHQAGNSDTGIKVFQYWGTKGLNRDDIGQWDPRDTGKIKWDNDFDLSPEKNQQYFYDLCEDAREHNIVQDGQIESFIFEFRDFALKEKGNFPVPQDQFLDTLKEFVKTPEGLYYYNSNRIGIIDNELKYVIIKLSAHGTPFAPYKTSNPIFKKWDQYNKQVHTEAPQGLKNCRQTAELHWVFMITEQAFVSSAIQGMLISIVFSFIVLLMTTHNIVISFYAILSISGIVVCVVSIMEMAGWELGVAESVTLVILIGLSIDYVVHLANHYIECVYEDRFRKMKSALEDLGISIISGASTTLGSGFFLFFATMLLFGKFAILIFSTILFSLVFALFFFPAMIHWVGPQGDTGNIIVYFKKCKNKLSKKKQKEYSEKQQQAKQTQS